MTTTFNPPSTLTTLPILADRRAGDLSAAGFRDAYLQTLTAADSRRANSVVMRALDAGLSPVAIQAHVVAPAMVAIGDMWERGQITVADEHLATAIAHSSLAELSRLLMVAKPASRERVLVAAVEGEHHALGIRMAADVLEGAGFRVLYMGADVPADALATAAADRQADVVLLGLSLPQGASRLEHAVAAVQAARPEARFVLGGQGVPDSLRDEIRFCPSTEMVVDSVQAALEERPPRTFVPTSSPDTADPYTGEGVESTLSDATARAADLARAHALDAERSRRLAFEDPLTGLPNRRAFEDRYRDAAAQGGLVVVTIDVDDFKQVNDRHGHDVGDSVLRQIADVLRVSLRPADFAARLGGDEFAVLLRGASAYEAMIVAERLRSAVEVGCDPRVTVSIGAAECTGDLRAALLDADAALYDAKSSGRNAVQVAGA